MTGYLYGTPTEAKDRLPFIPPSGDKDGVEVVNEREESLREVLEAAQKAGISSAQYPQEKASPSRIIAEANALHSIILLLEPLLVDSRERVLRWAAESLLPREEG